MSTIPIDTIINAAADIMKAIASMGVDDAGNKLVYPRLRYATQERDVEFQEVLADHNFEPPRFHFWMLFNTTSVPDTSKMGDLTAITHTIKFFGHMAVVDNPDDASLESSVLFRAELDAIFAAFADKIDLDLGCSITHEQFRVVNVGDGPVAGVMCHIAECALPVIAYNA